MKTMKFFAAFAAAMMLTMSTTSVFAANRSSDPNFKWDRQKGKVLVAASAITNPGFNNLGLGGEVAYLFPGKLGIYAGFETEEASTALSPELAPEKCRLNSGRIGVIADTTPDFPVGFFFKAGIGLADWLRTDPLLNLGLGVRASYGMFYTRLGVDANWAPNLGGDTPGLLYARMGVTVGIVIPTGR